MCNVCYNLCMATTTTTKGNDMITTIHPSGIRTAINQNAENAQYLARQFEFMMSAHRTAMMAEDADDRNGNIVLRDEMRIKVVAEMERMIAELERTKNSIVDLWS